MYKTERQRQFGLLCVMVTLNILAIILLIYAINMIIEMTRATYCSYAEPIIIHREVEDIEQEPEEEYIDPIDIFIGEITSRYDNVRPELIKSIIFRESTFNPNAKNGNHLGLMQVSTRWHSDRANKLGVTDFYDPYSNILLGTDYISELMTKHNDEALVLMLYSMRHDTAFNMYRQGQISNYAKTVLSLAEEYKKGG